MMNSISVSAVPKGYNLAAGKIAAYQAIRRLLRAREAGGLSRKALAESMGKDQGWLSRQLSGPGNWTLKTLGAFADALDGEVVIDIRDRRRPMAGGRNADAYAGYEPPLNITRPTVVAVTGIAQCNPALTLPAISAFVVPVMASADNRLRTPEVAD